ncbi:hypothetical protein CERSUDRAFT_101738 [Gelatoporia subvermispora B]|uniref:Uncharacterized protein n=1 Tax=Ceriporiopsis subvermispora (strain B) TaxID=914234 RepID=M2QUQ6_CERS8|nr:hypothetical protein CERSUDRAFT_101738 [Gelatoporia subvermispora B]
MRTERVARYEQNPASRNLLQQDGNPAAERVMRSEQRLQRAGSALDKTLLPARTQLF